MKKFLRKRWHSVPIGIISALLAVCLVTSGALAAYKFMTATVAVNVYEAIVADYTCEEGVVVGGEGYDLDVTVDRLVAGESKWLTLNLYNLSDSLLTLTGDYTKDSWNDDYVVIEYRASGGSWFNFNDFSTSIAGNGSYPLPMRVRAEGDCPAGDSGWTGLAEEDGNPKVYTFTINFSRE